MTKKNIESEYKNERRRFPSINQITKELTDYLETGKYEDYTKEQVKEILLSLLKNLLNDYNNLKLRLAFLEAEMALYEEYLEKDDIFRYMGTKEYVYYMYISKQQYKILSKIKNKTEINFKDLIIEIIFSEIARDTLKDIFPALSKDYNFKECCEEAGNYVAKRMLENESEIIL